MAGAANKARQAFKLKGTMPALNTLRLLTEDIGAIEEQLAEHIAQTPRFFLHAPVLLDLEALGGVPVDLTALAGALRRHRLVPVAVRNPTEAQAERAVAAGLGILQAPQGLSERSVPAERAREIAGAAAPPADAFSHKESASAHHEPPDARPLNLTVRQPVRSGQVVYAPGGDLIVLAAVSSGAELIADGNIHVYAPLRGRAVAGAHDNADANIFCMSLQAEFLSIAGHCMTSDEIPDAQRQKPARVHVRDHQLVVTSL
jgi:septum site-determining protein MinC